MLARTNGGIKRSFSEQVSSCADGTKRASFEFKLRMIAVVFQMNRQKYIT